jgi:hypothetical protein
LKWDRAAATMGAMLAFAVNVSGEDAITGRL